MIRLFPFFAAFTLLSAAGGLVCRAVEPGPALHPEVKALLKERCYDCHADGEKKGEVSFDTAASDEALLADKDLWFRVLKNVRGGLMPPPGKGQPTAEQKAQLAGWIKADVFQLDVKQPDPGRVTVRRLNRTEYRNTIRDLTGVDFRVEDEFPADDSGKGFDNNGDVLTIPTMLLEKYLAAAKSITREAVPQASVVMPEQLVMGEKFTRKVKEGDVEKEVSSPALGYYDPVTITSAATVPHAGKYTVTFDLTGGETYVEGELDANKCRLIFTVDGAEMKRLETGAAPGHHLKAEAELELAAGPHQLSVAVEPLTSGPRVRSLYAHLDAVVIRGPQDQALWPKPANRGRWFPEVIPAEPEARLVLARELLKKFATRAFRRPVDEATPERLARLAEAIWQQPDKTFEAGIARAMEAVLASPRFLFREEPVEPLAEGQKHPLIDEYSLASRLSYFLWTTMPDEELLRLAGEGKLRANLTAQFTRMMKDERSKGFFRDFIGQWLEARDVEGVPIDARSILLREQPPDPELDAARQRFFELRRKDASELTEAEKAEMEQGREIFKRRGSRFKDAEFSGGLRRDMRRETERYFEYVVREDRPLVELLDSDYAFLNEKLARHYKVPDVTGDEVHRVVLPPDSPRGGILTQGTFLAVTSNATRTSPVKRGQFILDNILGAPAPPPPANVPPLEDFSRGRGFEGTLRENLERHRADAKCASCHNRMDPIGLAFENFNAMGSWRELDRGKPVEPAGRLVSGEAIASAKELKRILATNHSGAFHRCLAEKLLTYALGRGLDWHDEATLDAMVARLDQNGGRAMALLSSVVESDAFLKRRATVPVKTASARQP